MNIGLFKNNNQIYTDLDLVNCLKHLDIQNGDILYMHSEIYNFGIPLITPKKILQIFIDCFFQAIGKEGTLIMPTFTYSFCNNKDYDKLRSKTKVGILNEFFRQQIGVKRTNDPIFSFAVKGAKEDLFLQDYDSCFGENSVFDILTKNNGKIILFGNKNLGITYVHYIEEKAKIRHRYFKEFSGYIINEKGIKTKKSIKYFVRDLKQNLLNDRDYTLSFIKNTPYYKEQKFGKGDIVSIEIQPFYDIIYNLLKTDDKILLQKDTQFKRNLIM
ncbi:AAC(3) family N-acetyltransferase [Campylobacter lari]|uniref:AAC(3) family N-acetyltransferase n=1 Tax=Campylobacter lari TaxID=201 RepID=UPI0021536C45|nr:AAC(3) family N-acetyltransferase [Campylobacter lari]MCR6517227.1 AAC(3) family N-acetyltransferase [Campylobacter lari]